MTIPIRNIFYLLCYAWDKLEMAGSVPVSQDERKTMADLFGRVLEAGVAHLLKRGLDRQYLTESVDTSSLRGKLDLTETVKRNLLLNCRVHCHVDDLSHDVLHNQILKTTIGKMCGCVNLDRSLRDRLLRIYRRLQGIRTIPINSSCFSRVVLHRNNAQYQLPLAVCRLIHEGRLIDESSGQSKFNDFLRDEKMMASLFERFVFHFFVREQNSFRVHRESFPWQDVECDSESRIMLPGMTTDVCLTDATRKIVIDAKYYTRTFQTGQFGKETIHSGNLYQLYAYLRNLDLAGGGKKPIEGILLYPTVGVPASLNYRIHGYRIRVMTVDMDQPWQQIHSSLLALLA